MARLNKLLQSLRDRYLFIFLLTLLLPCAAVAAFVQSTYIRQMDEHILSAARERTLQIQEDFDRIFESIGTVTDIVALDTDITEGLTPQQYGAVMDIRDLLSTLLVNQRWIQNVFVLHERGDYLISATGTYQKSNFYSVYKPGGMTEDAFYDWLREDGTGLLSAENAKRSFWLYSASFTQKRQRVHVLFLIEKTELTQLLAQYLTDGTGVIFVWDQAETVLASSTNDPELSEAVYTRLLDASDSAAGIVPVNGKRYVISKSGVSEYGWEAVSMITGDSLSIHAEAQNNIWILMLAIVFLVGVIMVIYLSNTMYKPIRSIKSKVEQLYPDQPEEQDGSANIYDSISAGIDFLQQQSLSMRSQIENHHQYLVGRLLQNGLNAREDLDQLYTAFNWDRSRDVFYVSLIQAAAGYSRDELEETIQTVQMRPIRFLVKEMYQEGTFAVLWITPRENCAVMEEQLELIRTGDSNILRIVCSSRWCALEGIPEAFIQVIVSMTDRDPELPEEACRQLRTAIAGRNWDTAARALDAVLPQLRKPAQLRFLCLSVALSVSGETIEGCPGDIFELAKVTDTAFYERYLRNATAFIRENAVRDGQSQSREPQLITKMVRYLNIKYNDPMFSVQEMADEFGMSMPALSKYFHEKHGMPLNEYTARLKMDRAKFLLENTDMSAAAISQDVGYTNAGSFGRRFRQMTGMSPMEYRRIKLFGKEENNDECD